MALTYSSYIQTRLIDISISIAWAQNTIVVYPGSVSLCEKMCLLPRLS